MRADSHACIFDLALGMDCDRTFEYVASSQNGFQLTRPLLSSAKKLFLMLSPHTMASPHCIDPHNCALDVQGNLKSLEDIIFYESATEDTPIQSSSRKGKDKAGTSSMSVLLSHM